MNRTSEYGRLSVAAKQARHREAMREPAIACPHCETMTMPADLLRHVEACPGPRDPHALNRWLTWGEALKLGVTERTLNRWVRAGRVRSRIRARPEGDERRPGRPAKRVYLERDIVRLLALRSRITGTRASNSA